MTPGSAELLENVRQVCRGLFAHSGSLFHIGNYIHLLRGLCEAPIETPRTKQAAAGDGDAGGMSLAGWWPHYSIYRRAKMGG